jgi:diadenosine tetraphosphate (Ap4A) HIT family hydrolase
MSATRSRKEQIYYKKYLKTVDKSVCVFCEIKKGSDQLLSVTKHFKVIKNIFPYSIWDGQKVVDHLMVTPKKHTDSIKDMPDSQKVEYVNLIELYEQKGYNIYARAPVSKMKSIVHQHTHLIKTEGAHKKLIVLSTKPYLRIVK